MDGLEKGKKKNPNKKSKISGNKLKQDVFNQKEIVHKKEPKYSSTTGKKIDLNKVPEPKEIEYSGEREQRDYLDRLEDVKVNEGTLEIKYRMKDLPDHLVITDPGDEDNVIFDTGGRISGTNWRKIRIPFKLSGDGTKLRIQVNPDQNQDRPGQDTSYEIEIKVIGEEKKKDPMILEVTGEEQ